MSQSTRHSKCCAPHRRCPRRLPHTALAATTILASSVLAVAALPSVARRPSSKGEKAAHSQDKRLSAQQKTLHALDRLTFGPRPGEERAVTQQGLEVWFEQQLHPERIPDTALETRLARYPAMQLPQTELMVRFPTPQRLKQYSSGALPAPEDPMRRAVYDDAALVYLQKREAKQTALEQAKSVVPSNLGVARSPAAAPAWRSRQAAGSPEAAPGEPLETGAAPRDAVLALPAPARFERLERMTPEQMQSFRASLNGAEQQRLLAGMTPQDAEQYLAMQSPEKLVVSEVLSTRLLRDVYSERQLQAVMTDFWLNHFSVFLHKDQNEPYLLPAYEREAILPNALGHFEDLLVATARSPAMLVYLDNWKSVGPHSRLAQRAAGGPLTRTSAISDAAPAPKGINENYARELMELHTLGVEGGYTQADVIEVAKCLTGWTIDRPAEGGTFLFAANRHEPGTKVVLGHTIEESGINEGLEVLHLLATRPATAHLISLELAQRFVSDTPPPALVQRMSATFMASDGDIKAVLSTMFHSPEFWSPSVARVKMKTPLEFLTSALRATGAEVTNPVPLVGALDRLGMPLYGKQTPNGYSPLAEDWVSSNALLTRMNFALVLSGNRLPGTKVDWPSLLPGTAGTNSSSVAGMATLLDPQTEGALEVVLFGEPAASRTREAAQQAATSTDLQQQAEEAFRAVPVSMGQKKGTANSGVFVQRKAAREAWPSQPPASPLATYGGLLLGSPEFQRR